jgi:hypothetical protein
VDVHLKVLGNADGEVDVALTAILGCVLAGTASPAKQMGSEQQIAEKYRIEAVVKTPFPYIFAIGFCRCDLGADEFI